MCNFAEDIEKVARGDEILAVVITHGRDTLEEDGNDDNPPYEILTWEEVRPRLDYTYDTGYGGADCHAIYAWTATRLIVVAEYDGSTSIIGLPRNPTRTALGAGVIPQPRH